MTTCPGCGKVVYFAERQTKDGKDWHGKCLQVYLKEQGKGAKGAHPFHSYTDAHRPPAPAVEAKKGPDSSPTVTPVAGSGPKFCGGCGASRNPSDKFCAGCGAKSQ